MLAGKVNKSKAFILTEKGNLIHVSSNDGIAHIEFQPIFSKRILWQNLFSEEEAFHSMALSSDQSYLIMVSHQVYSYSSERCNLKLGENTPADTAIHCNTIYLLNLNIIRNDLQLTLVDSLRLESVVEIGRST